MSFSASEQYLLELINRARLDPEAEAKRYGVDLNDGLSPGQIGSGSLQVLAPNANLAAAAESHSEWMLSNNVFSHTGAASSNAGDRAKSAGYSFNGTWIWRENLAWVGSTGDVNLEKAILEHHEGLYRSPSHRVNIFGANVREIGVAQVAGNFTHQGTTYNSSILTEVFAKSGSNVFVTGVAYQDANRDNFYSIGEGQSGIKIWTNEAAARTAFAGGYSMSVSPQDAVSLTVSDGNIVLGHLRVDTSDGNVKLDLVTDNLGNMSYDLSSSATLEDGILDARLLGLEDLALSGEKGHNRLYGNDGDNIVNGGQGNDQIWGRSGDDVLNGGSDNDKLFGNVGNDRLYGGQGHDVLKGGSDNDKLFGNVGNDRLYGGQGHDVLKGGSGNDKLFGNVGNDQIWGRSGDDVLNGGSDNDKLFGNVGNDWLYGGKGHDVLKGGSGDDRLDGGRGDDVMTGGGGADIFVFRAGEDRIKDFVDNTDTIAIDADLVRGMSVSEILSDAQMVQGDAVLNFGGEHVLTVDNISDLYILANDLIII
jgi:Ca2+-binding RTX toxin-like protein